MLTLRSFCLVLIALASLFAGCLMARPTTAETRTVTPVTDPQKAVIVHEGMVFGDSPMPTRGLRFPPGTYTLEAENESYWYFRSPAPLEFRISKQGQMVDGRDIPGGLMIAKGFNLVPAGAYVDGEGSTKVTVWKLGTEFLSQEGRSWKKTFKD